MEHVKEKPQSTIDNEVPKHVHDADIMDNVLSHVGDMGRYQKLLTFVMIFFGFIYAFVYFIQMFITATPENHWCKIPELAHLSMELRKNLSAPGAIKGDWDRCMTFDANWTEVLMTLTPPPDGTPLVPCAHGWEFELSDIPYETVVTERGWVCDRATHVPTAQSIFYVGAVIGALLFGWMADRFGRVPAIIATNLLGGIANVATIFTSTVWDFILCRFLVGLSFNNCFMILYVLVLEYVGVKYRTLVANLTLALSYTVAGAALPWMAYFIADWRILTWVTSAPMFVVLLAPWILPESVKWLVSRGRISEAVTVLKKFEKFNRQKIPHHIMEEFIIFCEKSKLEEKKSFIELLKSKHLRLALVYLILLFMGCGLVFDGLTRLSDSFGLSFFAVVSVYEIFEFLDFIMVAVILDRKNLSAPGAIKGDWDRCMTFDANWTEVLMTLTPPPDGTPLVPCAHGWEFELSDIPYETVVTERGWVCDRATHVPTAQSIFYVGAVIGALLFGWMADRFGRVPAIIATNLLGGIANVATIFTSTVWDFILCRFLVGLSFNNCFMILYVLVLEYVGVKYRTLVANLTLALSYTVAGAALPWMAYFIADWRILTWVTSAPMFVVLLAPWILPESVKWLVSRGRISEAVTVLKKFEKFNRQKIPHHIMEEFIIFCEKSKLEEKKSFIELLKSKHLRLALVYLILLFMGCGLVFDGLTRLSDSFGLSFFAVVSVYEIFEFLDFIMVAVILDRLGRRKTTSITAFMSSFGLIIALFVPQGLPQAILAIFSRFFIGASYTATVQWGTEVIPTPFRATGMSILHMFSFGSNIASPFIVYSRRVWTQLPMLIFAIAAIIVCGISILLPETRGLPLPQTRADGERIIEQHSLWRKRELTKADGAVSSTKKERKLDNNILND